MTVWRVMGTETEFGTTATVRAHRARWDFGEENRSVNALAHVEELLDRCDTAEDLVRAITAR
ncbi:MAG: hypothetical protein M3P83_01455 [Actinomycetota bacterium]|nr:hypothetical protein [Actinomycetota bacterium]